MTKKLLLASVLALILLLGMTVPPGVHAPRPADCAAEADVPDGCTVIW